ncbi:hypothetical protein EWM64_g10047 [Hericium alpestre]|uniref:F-box domain-containing protein n=1 Tax=Hericium alpestre TaxID=135208 RepID=A0A4Y9ZGT3_9AGAM|nr:hypothetical protein EWM64_g10047 [Hericium alpestre]
MAQKRPSLSFIVPEFGPRLASVVLKRPSGLDEAIMPSKQALDHSAPPSAITAHFHTKFFTNPILIDTLFSFLALTDILSLSRTCRTTNAAAKSYLGRALNVNRRLARFFPDPHAFRLLQARTTASFAPGLGFDAAYRGTELVLHVHRPHVLEIGEFFLGVGYIFQRTGRHMAEFEQACARLSRPLPSAPMKRLDELSGPVYDTFMFTKSIVETGVVLTIRLDILRVTNLASRISGI